MKPAPTKTQPTTTKNPEESSLLRLLAPVADWRSLTGTPLIGSVAIGYDGTRRGDEITHIDLYPPHSRDPWPPHQARHLLERELRLEHGTHSLETVLEAAALTLLDLRHPGWRDSTSPPGELHIPITQTPATLQTAA